MSTEIGGYDSNVLSNMDERKGVTTTSSGTKTALDVNSVGGLVTEPYDYIALTYVAAGNGAGEIETATYKTGGVAGTTVATLTLTYNADDEIATVTKT
jgi:hypothetical protein